MGKRNQYSYNPHHEIFVCRECGNEFPIEWNQIQQGYGRFCSKLCHVTAQKRAAADGLLNRFWSKVNKDGPLPEHRPELGQCWLWTAASGPSGYGFFTLRAGHMVKAHRYAWELATGSIPTADMTVLHTCDNRLCLRNDSEGTYEVRGVAFPRRGHLWLGTQASNSRDRNDKGRGAHNFRGMPGESNGRARLTTPTVLEIRRLADEEGLSQKEIAQRFGIAQHNVNQIVRRRTWRHL